MVIVRIKNKKSRIKIANQNVKILDFTLLFCILIFNFCIFSGFIFAEEQNPINITFIIHFDPLSAQGGKVPKENYEKERDNLIWLSDYLERLEKEKGIESIPRLTLEFGADHAEYYSEDEIGLRLLKKLYNKGIHSFGTHFHTNYKEGKHIWKQANRELRDRVTNDHIQEVDSLIAKIIGSQEEKTIRKTNHIITGHFLDDELAKDLGFDIQTGGINEAFNLFYDHDVYNPFRPQKRGWHLAEDKNGDWLLVPQSPVLGNIGEHSPIPRGISNEYTQGMKRMIWQDLSIPSMKRKFLHLYLEWLYQIKNNLPPKVWVFGWHEHTNNMYKDDASYGNARNLRDEVIEFIEWLNENFINRQSKQGQIIAKYSNVEETANDYLRWEEEFPQASSFNYPTQERDWEAYSYKLKGLARELMYSHYKKEISDFKNVGVEVHKLIRTNGRNWDYENGKVVCSGPIEEIYIIWSEEGTKTVDFSRYIKGKVNCIDAKTGESKVQESNRLLVFETPIIIIP